MNKDKKDLLKFCFVIFGLMLMQAGGALAAPSKHIDQGFKPKMALISSADVGVYGAGWLEGTADALGTAAQAVVGVGCIVAGGAICVLSVCTLCVMGAGVICVGAGFCCGAVEAAGYGGDALTGVGLGLIVVGACVATYGAATGIAGATLVGVGGAGAATTTGTVTVTGATATLSYGGAATAATAGWAASHAAGIILGGSLLAGILGGATTASIFQGGGDGGGGTDVGGGGTAGLTPGDLAAIAANITSGSCSSPQVVDIGGGEKLSAGTCQMDLNTLNRFVAAQGWLATLGDSSYSYAVIVNVTSTSDECLIDATQMNPAGTVTASLLTQAGSKDMTSQAADNKIFKSSTAYYLNFKKGTTGFALDVMPLPKVASYAPSTATVLCWSDVQDQSMQVPKAYNGNCPSTRTKVTAIDGGDYCCPKKDSQGNALVNYKSDWPSCCTINYSYSALPSPIEITTASGVQSVSGACCPTGSQIKQLTQLYGFDDKGKATTYNNIQCCPSSGQTYSINVVGTTGSTTAIQYCCNKTVDGKDVKGVGFATKKGDDGKLTVDASKGYICCTDDLQDDTTVGKLCVKK